MRKLLLVAAIALSGCTVSPAPTASPLPFPTRVLPSATPAPADARAYYEAGLACRTAGDTEGALTALSQALTVDPTFAPAYTERGGLYLALGETESALADAQAAVAADPESGPAYALLGEVLRVGLSDPAQALAAYEQAVRLDRSLAAPTFQARWEMAVAAGQPDRMVALANEYASRYPDDPLGAAYLGLALTALGNPNAATTTLIEMLEQGEQPAALWFALGESYGAEGAWANAKVAYEQARTLAENGDQSLSRVSATPVADLFARLGTAYVYAGECASGRTMLEYALSIAPERTELHTLIGQAMICLTPTPTPLPYPWWTPGD